MEIRPLWRFPPTFPSQNELSVHLSHESESDKDGRSDGATHPGYPVRKENTDRYDKDASSSCSSLLTLSNKDETMEKKICFIVFLFNFYFNIMHFAAE